MLDSQSNQDTQHSERSSPTDMWCPVRDQWGSGQHDLTALVEEDPAANGGSGDERQEQPPRRGHRVANVQRSRKQVGHPQNPRLQCVRRSLCPSRSWRRGLTRRWKVEHRTDVAYGPPCPKRRAGDLRAAAAQEIVGVDRGNAPTGIGCPHHSLDRITRSPILDIQAEQAPRGGRRAWDRYRAVRVRYGAGPDARARRWRAEAPRVVHVGASAGVPRPRDPPRHVPEEQITSGSCKGSRLASASMTATSGAVAATRPA